MLINDSVLSKGEIVTYTLRELYARAGYRAYSMSKFEEYDLYARNKDFLVSDNVITFTDTNGKLMALKPDVTLSIIKNSADTPGEITKVYYNENVYRVSKGTNSFKEIMQTGLECFGNVGRDEVCQVIKLASDSLDIFAGEGILDISDLDITEAFIKKIGVSGEAVKPLYKAIGEKNLHAMESILKSSGADPELIKAFMRLISLRGSIGECMDEAMEILHTAGIDAKVFTEILGTLKEAGLSEKVVLDFSVTDDINYYNGIVFKGFLKGIPEAVISGGQYDRLMSKLGRRSGAVGFAIYTDLLERVEIGRDTASEREPDFLNVALPKGRLGEKVYEIFAGAGFECPEILEQNRKLTFENTEKRIRYFWVKPSDVAIYVERGAADIGVCGKDILEEYNPDIYELSDLNMGRCRMAVAAPRDYRDDPARTLRVATKFSSVASDFYRAKGRDIDIIHLNGSIEIAPILGLSDVIVDIVETGKTLEENDLRVVEEIFPISARLIANKSSYKFKAGLIEKVRESVAGIPEENK